MWERLACQTLTGSIAANYLRLLLTRHILPLIKAMSGSNISRSQLPLHFSRSTNMLTHSWSVFFNAIPGSLSPPTLWISDWNLASLHRQEDGQWTLCYFSKCQSSLCMLALSNQMRITRLICLSTSSSPHLVVKLIANSGDVWTNITQSLIMFLKSCAHLIGVDTLSVELNPYLN